MEGPGLWGKGAVRVPGVSVPAPGRGNPVVWVPAGAGPGPRENRGCVSRAVPGGSRACAFRAVGTWAVLVQGRTGAGCAGPGPWEPGCVGTGAAESRVVPGREGGGKPGVWVLGPWDPGR